MIGWALLAVCFAQVVPSPGGAVLDGFRLARSGDSLGLSFLFRQGAKPRYRVKFCPSPEVDPCVRVEFAGAAADPRFLREVPAWIRVDSAAGPGVLGLRVDLRAPTPARYAWADDGFHLDILDRVREGRRWPWLGGIGAGVLAGGVAVWWILDGSPSKGNDVIPPPDAPMPR